MMEKYVNKKGFTLIELLVVIALVAALSIAMGINSIQTLNETQDRNNREIYATIFDAAKLYYKLKTPPEDCSSYTDEGEDITCGKVNPVTNTIKMCCIIEAGLLSEDYFLTVDPIAVPSDEGNDTFKAEKNITFSFDAEKKMVVSLANQKCGDSITTENIKEYKNWHGECNG